MHKQKVADLFNQNNYEFEPRGIMKWSPFAALYEYNEAVNKLFYDLDNNTKQEIDEHYYEVLNYLVQEAIATKSQVEITIFNQKEIQKYIDIILKVDDKSVYTLKKKILKNDIIDIVFIKKEY